MNTSVRSLRFRALGVVLTVTLLPILWIFASNWFDSADGMTQQRALFRALSAAEAKVDQPSDLASVAKAWDVRLRIVQGTDVKVDHDYGHITRWFQPAATPFFGPEGMPSLHEAERSLPPIWEREEVRRASEQPTGGCAQAADGLLLICAAAKQLGNGQILHVQRGSPRLIRSLHARRYQVLWLTLLVLAFGSLLALYVGARMVRPIEQLRDQVVARTQGTVRTDPVVLDRQDELGELAVAFNELLAALDTRNKSNAAFAADLAHELKNPVAAVQAVAELLDSDKPLDGSRKRRVQTILEDSTQRLSHVVDKFLQLARAEAGLQNEHREQIKLRTLLLNLVQTLEHDVRFQQVSFAVQGPEATFYGVSERIETACQNLLINAAHFALTSDQPRVKATLRAGPAEVRVSIEDTGPGVAEDQRDSIWERYFTGRQGGTGLGLPLTRAIVEAHLGSISIGQSALGGAQFDVHLPLTPTSDRVGEG